MGNFVNFQYQFYSDSSFLSLFRPCRPIPFYSYFNNMDRRYFDFTSRAVALPLCCATKRASFFYFHGFSFIPTLIQQCNDGKLGAVLFWSKHSSLCLDVFMLYWAHIKEILCLSTCTKKVIGKWILWAGLSVRREFSTLGCSCQMPTVNLFAFVFNCLQYCQGIPAHDIFPISRLRYIFC